MPSILSNFTNFFRNQIELYTSSIDKRKYIDFAFLFFIYFFDHNTVVKKLNNKKI